MNATDHEHAPASARASAPGRPLRLGLLLMVAVIVGYVLLRERWEQVAGSWLYLLLLACTLMHLFHGQGWHGGDGKPVDKAESAKE